MSSQHPLNHKTRQQATDELVEWIIQQMKKGRWRDDIVADIMRDRFLPKEAAEKLVDRVHVERLKAFKNISRLEMLAGGVMGIIGIVNAAAALSEAQNPSFGSFMSSLFLILFGGALFFHGLRNSLRFK